ncbi:MAG: DUF362 domain-containing protein [Sedimentisphaerales bacterium]|nr:DUF362 domain-containing protein [Sedimentisphaerales bacterium]
MSGRLSHERRYAGDGAWGEQHGWVYRRSLRWLLPLVGLGSLVWFLVRVIPKPSRAAYPCQRVAFPLASGFVLWLLGLAGSVVAFRKARRYFTGARFVAGMACLAVGVALLWLLTVPAEEPAVAGSFPVPNVPLGIARGVQPGRVVWIHEPNATEWEGYNSSQRWYDDACTDAAVVDKMLSRAIRGLAGESTDAAAWERLLRHFNSSRGKGDVGYTPGEKIAIKINNTLCYNANTSTFEQTRSNKNRIDNSPAMIAALLRQLVHVVGAAEEDITIGDPGRVMPNLIYDRVSPEFPNVRYLSNVGGPGRPEVEFSDVPLFWSTPDADGTKQDFLPKSFAEADYFINFPILKTHGTGGITVCGKNHYGSLIRNPDGTLRGKSYDYYDMHDSLAGNAPAIGQYRCLVDLMGHWELGGKTLLYLVDGLFAGKDWSSDPKKWNIPPFYGNWPSSIFASQDPVAIDCVCFDFLWLEWHDHAGISGTDDYLLEAALADDPPSGTFYDPEGDGVPLASLGTYEHWNDPWHKQYSRNLGTGDGIELTRPVKADFDGDSNVRFADLATLSGQWLTVSPTLSADLSAPGGDGVVSLRDFAAFARYWTPRPLPAPDPNDMNAD